jgi:hypothetical protein
MITISETMSPMPLIDYFSGEAVSNGSEWIAAVVAVALVDE